jgi:hypothetical protein
MSPFSYVGQGRKGKRVKGRGARIQESGVTRRGPCKVTEGHRIPRFLTRAGADARDGLSPRPAAPRSIRRFGRFLGARRPVFDTLFRRLIHLFRR